MMKWILGIGVGIFFSSTFAFAADNQSAKLEIYLRNQLANHDTQRGLDVMSYFRYLRAKHPTNAQVQEVLSEASIFIEWHLQDEKESDQPLIIAVQEAQKNTPTLREYPWSTASLVPGNFDEDLIEQTWIDRVNNEIRIPRWLKPISWEYRLRETARDRSLSLRAKGVADHKRFSYSGYYDYQVITDWFADRGVVFENRNRATSTENIGRARHTCEGDNCTDAVIKDIRRIYDYFASEESYNGVHWRTMIHPEFRVVGVSFAIDYENDKVFAVMHYGTAVQ